MWDVFGFPAEAHPAISIILSLDFEHYHLELIQGYKYRVPPSGESGDVPTA